MRTKDVSLFFWITGLHFVCKSESTKIVQFLLEEIADVNAKLENEVTE